MTKRGYFLKKKLKIPMYLICVARIEIPAKVSSMLSNSISK